MKDRWAAERAKWRELVTEQARSGRSSAAFCRERELRKSQFFAWKRRLRDAEAARFVAVEVARSEEEEQRRTAGRAIEVRLGRGRSLMVEPGFDAEHLRTLLDALEAAS